MQELSIKQFLSKEIKAFFKLKKSDRLWHIPVLASLCIGIPLLIGLAFDNVKSGLLASLSGLVILYIPTANSIVSRMATMLICSFGFMVSYAVGLIFSFNPFVSTIVFGIFSTMVYWINLYFKTKPPASFFFIMIASLASGMPHDLSSIPQKIGLIAMGTMLACTLALLYSFLVKRKNHKKDAAIISDLLVKSKYADLVEAMIVGSFMFTSMLIGHVLKLQNPYWIPISCLAVMQGVNLYHIWQRVIHRILGTFLGLGLCWLFLSIVHTPFSICITIIVLQFIIEILIVRHYALAVIFITPMTILLAEAANPLILNPDLLIATRFLDISIGSLIGAIGGWFVHNEKIRFYTTMKIRKAKLVVMGK
ncbi:FUSC family protein [Arcicella lustrica]|uniref:FUSC family protein n=1 Tax=Arcicella lustrica TaxID=2984196 RepID=A0ABU5SMJ5_9BACT|nr:FUSC family protein [Arcicella sp. DC25W]MEA5428502.1 FUSC family protein [Arcicella sp. DC25W]